MVMVGDEDGMMATSDGDCLPVWRLVTETPRVGHVMAPMGAPVSGHRSEAALPGPVPIPRPGQRIRLVALAHDPDPPPPGTLGTVGLAVSRLGPGTFQVDVEWDCGCVGSLTEIDRWEPVEIVNRWSRRP